MSLLARLTRPAPPRPASLVPGIVPVIETPRLTLRGLDARDFEAFAAFFATPRARFVGGPLDRETAWKVLARVIGHWTLRGYGTFGFVPKGSDGPAIGMAGPWFPEGWPEPEIGWMLWDERLEGRGYAREAVEAARSWAYGTLGWTTAVSYIHADNPRSIALAERLGARPDPEATFPDADPCIAYRHPAPPSAGAELRGEAMTAMTDDASRAAELLKGHRESIDRLDAILVYTLAERFKHTQNVGRLKAEHDLPPSDPAREGQQIERLEWLAREADLDPEFARKFLNFIISEVIRHHQQINSTK